MKPSNKSSKEDKAMTNEEIKKLDKDQLNEVTGGKWDEENQWPYEDGVIEEMGGRTAIVYFDVVRKSVECGYSEEFEHGRGLKVGTRVRVRMVPVRTIYMILG